MEISTYLGSHENGTSEFGSVAPFIPPRKHVERAKK